MDQLPGCLWEKWKAGMGMEKGDAMRLKTNMVSFAGNAAGAVLTYLYFAHTEGGSSGPRLIGPVSHHLLFFIIATALIFLAVIVFNYRWSLPLFQTLGTHPSSDGSVASPDKHIQRKALHFAPMMALTSLVAWILAGFVFGMVMPVTLQIFFGLPPITLTESMGRIFGITCVGGSITTLIVYFSIEALWRRQLPRFFPDGALSQVRGAFRLTVKVRLLASFLIISVIPLTMLGVSAYVRAKALQSADPATGDHILASLLSEIVFITAVGVVAAVLLSLFVSKSVSAPLKDMSSAMKAVGKGDLDVRIRVVSNDEIGEVGEGFVGMIQGLRESEAMKESFGRYVTQEIRDEILAGRVSLDGEMKRATLLFSDLRDFTPFVESSHPKQVVSLMNQYFSEMTEAIKAYQGLILQYVGDEIEAVFGAPVPHDDHPDMAVRAALEMRNRLQMLNQRLEDQGVSPFRHGIGIHTGAVLAGIIGSQERSSYALVGDTVNLASRIQGLTKDFSCDIILSQTTHDLVTGSR
jgi:adenylate cyclase